MRLVFSIACGHANPDLPKIVGDRAIRYQKGFRMLKIVFQIDLKGKNVFER